MKKIMALLVAVSVCGGMATSAVAKDGEKIEALQKAAKDVTLTGVVGSAKGEGGKTHYTLKTADGTVYRMVGQHEACAKLDGMDAKVTGKAVEKGDKALLRVITIVHVKPPK